MPREAQHCYVPAPSQIENRMLKNAAFRGESQYYPDTSFQDESEGRGHMVFLEMSRPDVVRCRNRCAFHVRMPRSDRQYYRSDMDKSECHLGLKWMKQGRVRRVFLFS
jgi:hypothetical protein